MKHNPNKIKKHRTYMRKELAKALGVCPDTVRTWSKKGLCVVNSKDGGGHFLYKGETVKAFLREKRKFKKTALRPEEFYCLRCKAARESLPEAVIVKETGKFLGDGSKQVVRSGVCKECGGKLSRLSKANAKITE